jgi:hypothetical protein
MFIDLPSLPHSDAELRFDLDEGAVIDRIAVLMRSHVGKGNSIMSGKIVYRFQIRHTG